MTRRQQAQTILALGVLITALIATALFYLLPRSGCAAMRRDLATNRWACIATYPELNP